MLNTAFFNKIAVKNQCNVHVCIQNEIWRVTVVDEAGVYISNLSSILQTQNLQQYDKLANSYYTLSYV